LHHQAYNPYFHLYFSPMQFSPELSYTSLSEQNAYQSQALQQLLVYLTAKSPFYRRLFREHNVDISKIKNVADLRLMPTTSKSDMQDFNWDFLCVPRGEIKEYTSTSGTMGHRLL